MAALGLFVSSKTAEPTLYRNDFRPLFCVSTAQTSSEHDL